MVEYKCTPGHREFLSMTDAGNFRSFRYPGYCVCCEQHVLFEVSGPYLRDTLLCGHCRSIPRERAITEVFTRVLNQSGPVAVHETSPVDRGFSAYLQRHYGDNYIASQFWPERALGEMFGTFRNENIEHLTFADQSVDVHVSQDVFEHVFDPGAAAREIFRTLRPGGFHIFTTPLIARSGPTRRRAKIHHGQVELIEHPAEYHGSPVSEEGALVTFHFGHDLPALIDAESGLQTSLFSITDVAKGIVADLNEVMVSWRPHDGPRARFP